MLIFFPSFCNYLYCYQQWFIGRCRYGWGCSENIKCFEDWIFIWSCKLNYRKLCLPFGLSIYFILLFYFYFTAWKKFAQVLGSFWHCSCWWSNNGYSIRNFITCNFFLKKNWIFSRKKLDVVVISKMIYTFIIVFRNNFLTVTNKIL